MTHRPYPEDISTRLRCESEADDSESLRSLDEMYVLDELDTNLDSYDRNWSELPAPNNAKTNHRTKRSSKPPPIAAKPSANILLHRANDSEANAGDSILARKPPIAPRPDPSILIVTGRMRLTRSLLDSSLEQPGGPQDCPGDRDDRIIGESFA